MIFGGDTGDPLDELAFDNTSPWSTSDSTAERAGPIQMTVAEALCLVIAGLSCILDYSMQSRSWWCQDKLVSMRKEKNPRDG